MRNYMLMLMPVLGLAACGYSSKQNEMVGQVKKVIEKTPVICGDYIEADLSLGVMRNGVGSMSHEDVSLYVPNLTDELTLKKAAETGQLVKVTYDVKRLTWCVPDHLVIRVELFDDKLETPATK